MVCQKSAVDRLEEICKEGKVVKLRVQYDFTFHFIKISINSPN